MRPVFQVALALFRGQMAPGMVGREVEAAGAAGNAHAAADAHQPFVVGQRLTGLAALRIQVVEAAIELRDKAVQHALGDGRVATVRIEHQLLLVQILEHVGLEIGACSHVHDLKHGDERKVMIQGMGARNQFTKTAK
ncbi:hypothetical protein SDC9_109754 [bioreactor metagenome]|uniref:Uncharacterized protein n=1 Tax=bioreactor metagenome TaxID=1076179 RepID=A0A645BCQ5_9ZZZZ